MISCVIVAAGSGDRFGGPKQFAEICGQRVVDVAIASAAAVADQVVVVLPAGCDHALAHSFGDGVETTEGGASRSASVRAGLGAVRPEATVVLVHDAARPLADRHVFDRVVAAVQNGADAVVPVVPVTDTIRLVDGGAVDRATLLAVQTPQGFSAEVLREAHASGLDATDDASLVETAGGTVVVVDGHPDSFKITNPGDLAAAAALLSERP